MNDITIVPVLNSDINFCAKNLLNEVIIFSGKEITKNISVKYLNTVSKKYSKELTKHKITMLQLTPHEVFQKIESGLMVLAFDKESKNLVAGARLYKHAENIYEICSWIAFKEGYGKTVIKPAKLLIHKYNSKAKVIAVIEKDNLKAQIAIEKNGAKILKGKPYGLEVMLEKPDGTKANVIFYKL